GYREIKQTMQRSRLTLRSKKPELVEQELWGVLWICPYISRHLLSLNPLLACCRRYSRGER
ncbi:hypothetical protein E8D91_23035, partial [Escherichia coli]|nr:hypothetical protein [Escherichia coli]MDJ1490827.1 hypothetical protein [Escherichia coli]